jgi:hypothetical protein
MDADDPASRGDLTPAREVTGSMPGRPAAPCRPGSICVVVRPSSFGHRLGPYLDEGARDVDTRAESAGG